MRRLLCALAAAPLLLLSSGLGQAACGPEQELALMTGVLYREAHATRPAQAAVASVVFNRVNSGRYGSTVCAVITAPGQFVYRLPPRPNGAKLAMARENARTFLRERGYHQTAGDVFARLKGFDSFHAEGYRGQGRRKGPVIGDNVFYRRSR